MQSIHKKPNLTLILHTTVFIFNFSFSIYCHLTPPFFILQFYTIRGDSDADSTQFLTQKIELEFPTTPRTIIFSSKFSVFPSKSTTFAGKSIIIMLNEAIQLLSQLIATPSISRDEQAAADILQNYLQDKGFQPQRHGNNLWVLSPDFNESKPTILLNAHIDTVKPVSAWQRNPFQPSLEGDTLYGLGSNDCGGGLVSLLQVFITLSSSSSFTLHSSFNLVYLASCEEEVSGKNGIESVLPLLPKIDFAIVGEPTGMQPAIAEKGLMVIDATAHGKAGHAARNEGDNAIYRAMKDIAWIQQYQFPKQT